jgi:DNA repair ATPase RecN
MTLDNDLWLLDQRARSLQECRRDIAWVWDDEAARELNRRYLDPHAADDAMMREALHREVERLEALRQAVEAAEEATRVAEDRAERMRYELGEMEREMKECEGARGRAIEYVSEADELLPKIADLIEQANRACD